MWLDQKISPKQRLDFYCFEETGKQIVIVEIESAKSIPIKFDEISYVRIGESTAELKNYPHLEQRIWNSDRNKTFEKSKALEGLNSDQILHLLDYDKYFQLTKQELPSETVKFVEKLVQEKFVSKETDNSFAITVL
jgi:predicted HTH transcriptional regulator